MLQSYQAPAVELEDLVSKAKDLKKDGDAFAGSLRGALAEAACPHFVNQ